jgi:hypothetical protein
MKMAAGRVVWAMIAASLLGALPASAKDASFLPLEVGNRWELSSSAGQSMAFEVIAKSGPAYVIRWDNPWVKAEFTFVPVGNRVLLAALDMGAGTAQFPPETVYFDFDARSNATWSNSLGTVTVMARSKQIATPSAVYQNCIEFKETDKKKFSTFFSLASGTGFVQFGEGNAAFYLTSFGSRRTPGPEIQSPEPPPAPSGISNRPRSSKLRSVLIGIDSNPAPDKGYSKAAREEALRLAVDSGATYISFLPKWSEIEPSPGHFDWSEVDFRGRVADKYHLPISLNIRVVDGGSKSVNSEYARWQFDDPRLTSKLTDLIRAMGRHLRGHVRWVSIGNEIDHYFNNHANEIERYARLLAGVIPEVRQSFPGALVTVNFSNQSTALLRSRYRAITLLQDFYSYNYYPLNGDFTMRAPSVARPEMLEMINAAENHDVMFQEIGYSSGAKVDGSEERQARFLEEVFATLHEFNGRVFAATVNWMSDIPDSVVNQLGEAYRLPDSDKFKEFLGTLGLFDKNGRPKAAWLVFRREAPRLAR